MVPPWGGQAMQSDARWMVSMHDMVSITPGKTPAAEVHPPAAATLASPATPHRETGTQRENPVPDTPLARQTALRVQGLGKTFRSGFLRRRDGGVQDVSFTVPEGSVFALLGHNGAGKTTTINSILDLIHPDSGTVEIFGVNHRRQEARRQVGYLPERPYFFEHLTGRELLGLYADLLEIPAVEKNECIDQVLERTRMAEAAGRRLRKYSKGMLQRIGLAQALLGDPRLLILDEPMSGLDPLGRREVRHLLQELKAQGKTIILSSHIVPDVEMLADTVGILRQGRMVHVGTLAEATGGGTYQVRIAGGTDQSGYQVLTAHGVDALREVLDRCGAEGLPVLGVEAGSGILEDLFVKAHESQEAR